MTVATNARFRGPLARAFEAAGVRDGDDLLPLLRAPAESLPVPPAARWDAGTVDRATVADIARRAEAERGSPWPQPLASAAARFHRDGDRVGWERPAFARQERISRATLMAAATGDDAWLAEAVDGAWQLCEQSSWCWPAHDDAHARRGHVLADVTHPFLDLGAAEAVAQLAWLDHVLGERIDAHYPGVRARIRREARVRVFEPFTRRRDWHWLGLDGHVHNWNPWIHGAVIVAALRLLDEPDQRAERAHLIALALEGLDRYVAALPDDGAIDEGYAYWWNGACRLLEALDLIAHATAGRLDPVRDVPALRATVAFPHRMHLGDGWYVNVADGQARPPRTQPWHALLRAARRAGDAEAAAHALSHRAAGTPAAHESEGLGRLLLGATDAAWFRAAPAIAPAPRETWLPSTQMLVARERAGSHAGLTLVAKGGYNGENHNHNDVGTVIVASDGVPVVVDAGRPTYTAQTFGPGRYELWPMRSDWHSVPFVAGSAQPPGAEFGARDAAAELADDTAALSLELAGAYDVPALRSWRRRALLDRRRGRIVIRDEWDLDDTAAETSVRLLIGGDVELAAGSARVTPLGGARPLLLAWDRSVPVRRVTRELDDPLLTDVWGDRLTRLDLDVRGRSSLEVVATREETR